MIDLQNLEILYAMTIFLKDFNLNLYNKDFKKGNTILEINLKKITKNKTNLKKLVKIMIDDINYAKFSLVKSNC